MKLIIHRGTNQIGGSCVEVASRTTRLILDVGLPLNADPEVVRSTPERYRPKVEGVFAGAEGPLADAVLLTHFHPDHSRFLTDVHPAIPIYMSAGTRLVMEALGLFISKRLMTSNVRILPDTGKVTIGDIEVEAIPVDHSAPASLAFVLRGEGKAFLYTGDFRAHGRQEELFDDLIARAPKPLDALLVEGTMVGSHRAGSLARSELELEAEIAGRIRAAVDGPILAKFSPTNLDRVVTFIQASRTAGVELVLDLFTSYLCDQLSRRGRPDASLDSAPVRVLYFRRHAEALAAGGSRDFLIKMRPRKIEFSELSTGKKVILFRPGHLKNYAWRKIAFPKAPLLSSQYEGVYPGQEGMMEAFNAYVAAHDIQPAHVHTSGHAFEEHLKTFVDALRPRVVIPIHTCHPGDYINLFPNHSVRRLADGEPLDF